MNRAYSLVTIVTKGTSTNRVIEGVATTPSPDRVGDIVEPDGATFKLPLPLLWQHNHSQPIGTVESAKVTPRGIEFRARLATTDKPGVLKDRLDEAWESIQLGLTRAVSIGFRPLEYSHLDGGGTRFTAWEWMELSVVTIPANSEATLATAKFYATHPTLKMESGWNQMVDKAMANFEEKALEMSAKYKNVSAGFAVGHGFAQFSVLLKILKEVESRLVAVEDAATSPGAQE